MTNSISILIVGANFSNKGAQSMLFVTVDEIKKRAPTAKIYFGSTDAYNFSNYSFDHIFYSEDAKKIALGKKEVLIKSKRYIRDVIKYIVGRRTNLFRVNELKSIIKNINLIVDISGYSLGEKWSVSIQEGYLNNIRLAKKYKIPIILMPQSFGPFNYCTEKEYLLQEMAELLPYPKLIFAREKEGFRMMQDLFCLSNVSLSTDLVLQSNGIDLVNIFKNEITINVPHVEFGSVGIVPNIQCIKHGEKDKILYIYQCIIEKLIENGKKVYIFRHSAEDIEVCREIAALGKERITLIENDFSCIEYDAFIKQFDFIVCSRYHGAVHAYRNSVPCILLGWAVKYEELAELLEQSRFSFDITKKSFHLEVVENALDDMCEKYNEESETINKILKIVQRDNCFEKVLNLV